MGSTNIVERQIHAYIENMRPEEEMRDKLDIGFSFENNVVEIFEIRPVWDDKSKKANYAVAQGRYIKSRGVWKIYWKRSDLKWHIYQPLAEVNTVQEFLDEVSMDPYGCFFG